MMSRLVEPVGPGDHVLGSANAPVTVVEYGDYECPFCRRAHHEVAEVLRRVGNDARYAFRHFPLSQIHPHALLAAQAAEAAGAQDQFWSMHGMLFENQRALDLQDLLAFAERIDLDVARFTEELRNGTHLPHVQHDFRSGVRSGVNGTPTFFIGEYRHDGGWDADTLTPPIERAARARLDAQRQL
jgi:protein-disulfide isomerase